MINNERIACYRQAMAQANNLDSDLRLLFEDIALEAERFKEELIDQLKQIDTTSKSTFTLSGMVHMAWKDLKATFSGGSRNAVISYCLYNEEVALQSYTAALNLTDDTMGDIQSILERQHALLNETYGRVKKNRQVLHRPALRLMYFN